MSGEVDVIVFDMNKFADGIEEVIKIIKKSMNQQLETSDTADRVEDIEPKVSCKKNATEELVRILKLNRARRDDIYRRVL